MSLMTICSGVNASYSFTFCNFRITESGRGMKSLLLLCIVVDNDLFIFFRELNVCGCIQNEASDERSF